MDKATILFGGAALGFLIGWAWPKNKRFQYLIIQKLNIMGENLNEVKQALQDASAKADRIQADVTKLTNAIGNTGETPTAEEWAEVKTLAADLNTKLQGIDDQTAEDEPPVTE